MTTFEHLAHCLQYVLFIQWVIYRFIFRFSSMYNIKLLCIKPTYVSKGYRSTKNIRCCRIYSIALIMLLHTRSNIVFVQYMCNHYFDTEATYKQSLCKMVVMVCHIYVMNKFAYDRKYLFPIHIDFVY